MRNIITTDTLKQLSAAELEDYRASGEDFRRELTHAVMRDLNAPEAWEMNGEYRSEFGGFFPVQVRFTTSHHRFQLAVCSSGDVSPDWMIMFITASGHPFAVISTMPVFSPDLINHTLSLIARLDADGYGSESIISVLAMEGAK